MTGFININKAQGMSSAQEVNKIKRLTGKPCGHMGTLDPMASGVLPVAVGNAARLFDYFLSKSKTYIATFVFGKDSDTLDTTGNILKTGERIPGTDEINSVLSEFVGEIDQIPPKYSAKCINGKRGYQLARDGVEFELSPKKVKIYSIEYLEQVRPDTYSFEIECGGGTYIRSLARDIGARLNTCAIMSSLVRTKSGVFTLDTAVKTEILNTFNISDFLIPTESVLDLNSIYPSAQDAKKLFNGLPVQTDLTDGIYKIFDADSCFYGLADIKAGILKVKTKLC